MSVFLCKAKAPLYSPFYSLELIASPSGNSHLNTFKGWLIHKRLDLFFSSCLSMWNWSQAHPTGGVRNLGFERPRARFHVLQLICELLSNTPHHLERSLKHLMMSSPIWQLKVRTRPERTVGVEGEKKNARLVDATRLKIQFNFCHRCLLGPSPPRGIVCQTVENDYKSRRQKCAAAIH